MVDSIAGKPEHHDYQLYLALKDTDHTRTNVRHPRTNGIVERVHKTNLNEFYQVAYCRLAVALLDSR